MKTAVSMPDKTFKRAEDAAKLLGMSRSELVSRAVERYVDDLERSTLTQRIDAALERSGTDEAAAEAVVLAGHATLTADGEEW
jgi:predicted DNA-binding protein